MNRRHSHIFREFAHDYGLGVMPRKGLSPNWRKMLFDPLDAISDLYGSGTYTNKRGGQCKFELGYIKHNCTRGAVSARRSDRLCAGIFTTTALQFWESVSCLFLDPIVYPEFGNPSLSVHELRNLQPTTVPGFYWEHFQENHAYNKFILRITNKCPVRTVFIRRIASYMLEFYWFHEIAHLQLGHPDLWLDRFGEHELDEAPDEREHEKRRVKVVLEKQADASALINYFSKEYADSFEPAWSHIANLEFRIVALFFVFNIWIWGEFRQSEPGRFLIDVSGDYPHAVERYDNIMRAMVLETLDREETDRLVRKAWKELRMAGEPPLTYVKRRFDTQQFKSALDRARRRLETLSKASSSFEALEAFRGSMAPRLEEARQKIGGDNLLAAVFDGYVYS